MSKSKLAQKSKSNQNKQRHKSKRQSTGTFTHCVTRCTGLDKGKRTKTHKEGQVNETQMKLIRVEQAVKLEKNRRRKKKRK